jgi:hypothetical protein
MPTTVRLSLQLYERKIRKRLHQHLNLTHPKHPKGHLRTFITMSLALAARNHGRKVHIMFRLFRPLSLQFQGQLQQRLIQVQSPRAPQTALLPNLLNLLKFLDHLVLLHRVKASQTMPIRMPLSMTLLQRLLKLLLVGVAQLLV